MITSAHGIGKGRVPIKEDEADGKSSWI